jgi:hypothetical protein
VAFHDRFFVRINPGLSRITAIVTAGSAATPECIDRAADAIVEATAPRNRQRWRATPDV